MKSHKILSALISICSCGISDTGACTARAQASSDGDGIGTANFTTTSGEQLLPKATTIPYFRSSFTTQPTCHLSLHMVGTILRGRRVTPSRW